MFKKPDNGVSREIVEEFKEKFLIEYPGIIDDFEGFLIEALKKKDQEYQDDNGDD